MTKVSGELAIRSLEWWTACQTLRAHRDPSPREVPVTRPDETPPTLPTEFPPNRPNEQPDAPPLELPPQGWIAAVRIHGRSRQGRSSVAPPVRATGHPRHDPRLRHRPATASGADDT